ncbi:CpaD family pilus assembly protein [Blastochloris sulfoviridis]|uniref:Pilus assembly protein CpaD n=1 Tax=Blastochloris sulfoviridis TaxID=50712 RepID=A0A5M6I6T0_9HYPH|nr:CpaD family pilus assembly protein [Blastochloris sulfoviridis]KAA5603419.1 pilus assembly protein CpaD [Blastochloris sulfoviridis]
MPSSRLIARAVAGAALATLLAGCHANQVVDSGYPVTVPDRHPIRIVEGRAVHEVLIGTGRGTLTAVQRAELTAFAGNWRRRGTGPVFIEVPAGTDNEQAARIASREVRSLLVATGIPGNGISLQPYQPFPEDTLAPLRVVYPVVKAEAGPCGVWPDDLGVQDMFHQAENRQYWNFGCANQKALAAMVDNPADLVQPRREQAASAARRQTVVEKYIKGEDTATKVNKSQSNKLSDEVDQ